MHTRMDIFMHSKMHKTKFTKHEKLKFS